MQHRFFRYIRYDYGKWSFNFRVFIDYDLAILRNRQLMFFLHQSMCKLDTEIVELHKVLLAIHFAFKVSKQKLAH